MRIYVINDLTEDGPTNFSAATTPAGIRTALHTYWRDGRDTNMTALRKIQEEAFNELLDANDICSETLPVAWSGLQFHIVDTVD